MELPLCEAISRLTVAELRNFGVHVDEFYRQPGDSPGMMDLADEANVIIYEGHTEHDGLLRSPAYDYPDAGWPGMVGPNALRRFDGLPVVILQTCDSLQNDMLLRRVWGRRGGDSGQQHAHPQRFRQRFRQGGLRCGAVPQRDAGRSALRRPELFLLLAGPQGPAAPSRAGEKPAGGVELPAVGRSGAADVPRSPRPAAAGPGRGPLARAGAGGGGDSRPAFSRGPQRGLRRRILSRQRGGRDGAAGERRGGAESFPGVFLSPAAARPVARRSFGRAVGGGRCERPGRFSP